MPRNFFISGATGYASLGRDTDFISDDPAAGLPQGAESTQALEAVRRLQHDTVLQEAADGDDAVEYEVARVTGTGAATFCVRQ